MKEFLDKQGLEVFYNELNKTFGPKGQAPASILIRQQMIDFDYENILQFETELSDAAAIVGVAICGVTLLGQS